MSTEGCELNSVLNEASPTDPLPSALKSKLEKLICDVTDFTTFMSRICHTWSTFENRVSAMETSLDQIINESQPTIQNRLSELDSHVDVSFQVFENRVRVMETSMEKICDQSLPSIANRLNELGKVVDQSSNVSQSRDNIRTSLVKHNAQLLFDNVDDVATIATLVDSTHKDHMTVDDAVQVLPTATRYGMKRLTAKLSRVLCNALIPLNCIYMFQLASKFELEDLFEASREMICDQFKLISESAVDFCNLTFEELCLFIFSDNVAVAEGLVFNAICRWVRSDLNSRRHLITNLLTAVPVSKYSLKFLQEIKDNILVCDQTEFQEIIQKRIKQLTYSQQVREVHREVLVRTKKQDVLFVVGGSFSDGVIETFNFSKRSWIPHTIPDSPGSQVWAVSNGSIIFVIDPSNKLHSFDPQKRIWKSLKPMPVFRQGFCLAQDGSRIYAMGGYDCGTRCDVYDCSSNTWSTVTSLKYGRRHASSVSYRGRIYCSGGKREDDAKVFGSMEVYSTKNDKWYPAGSMLVPCALHSLVSCSDSLWAVGGWNGSAAVNTLQKYDTEEDTWTKMRNMPTNRYRLTVSVYEGLLYAIGGTDGKVTDVTEIYDPAKDSWSKCAQLCKARGSPGSCVIHSLSNAEEYAVPLSLSST